ncbi:MAG: hypothetical protein ACOYJZ_09505 [Acutalibacter sp.]|jgi:uncharacterized protein (UPF0297 family)
MMKKLLALGLSLTLVLSLGACAATGEQLPALVLESASAPESSTGSGVESGAESGTESGAESQIQVEEVSDKDYEDSLDGLRQYLVDSKAVAGDATEMAYETIGAVEGYRYRFTLERSTVQVEVYEYDLENLSDEATAVLDSVKEKGTFSMLNKEVSAVLSDSGKYMMIYTDASKDQLNTQQKERVEELFQSFKA